MPTELDRPIILEIDQNELEIDSSHVKQIWDVARVANLQIDAAAGNQFPKANRLTDIQKSKLNNRIKDVFDNQNTLVVRYGTFAVVLDSAQGAYYQIDDLEARRVLSGKSSSLKTKAFSGKPSANISFDDASAWINVSLDQKSFAHELYGPDYPDVPLIYEVPTGPEPPILLFGFNPYAKYSLYLEKSVA
ncbi:MAG: hypothetical protein AAB512_03100 [Patescibacteria group bacterium]